MVRGINFENCLVDLSGGVTEFIDVNRFIREQKTLQTLRHNSNIIIRMLKKAKLIGSVCFVKIQDDDGSIISDIDDESSTFTLLAESQDPIPSQDESAISPTNQQKNSEGSISFQDFFEKYNQINLIHLNLNNLKFSSKSTNKQFKWDFKQIIGKWPSTKTAINIKTMNIFAMPQHTINLKKTDEDRSMIISLMTTDYKERRKQNKKMAPIAFELYKLKQKKTKVVNFTFTRQNFSAKELKRVGKSSDNYVTEREICKRFIVSYGVYVIIPLIIDVTAETNYLLRVYTENIKSDDGDDDDDENGDYEEINEVEDFELKDDNETSSDEENEDSDDDKQRKMKSLKSKMHTPRRK